MFSLFFRCYGCCRRCCTYLYRWNRRCDFVLGPLCFYLQLFSVFAAKWTYYKFLVVWTQNAGQLLMHHPMLNEMKFAQRRCRVVEKETSLIIISEWSHLNDGLPSTSKIIMNVMSISLWADKNEVSLSLSRGNRQHHAESGLSVSFYAIWKIVASKRRFFLYSVDFDQL